MNFVLDAAVAEQLLLVDAHQGLAVDAGVEHVVRVHRILLTKTLKRETIDKFFCVDTSDVNS